MSPPRLLPLMGLLSLQSFICSRPARSSGSSHPRAFPFPVSPRYFSDYRPPPLSRRVHPLMSSRSPAEYNRFVSAPSLQYDEDAFLGVPSLFATSTSGVTSGPRLPHREPCRPRRFARPRRFTPPLALRVYFTPQPRPGFALQGFSSRRSRTVSSTARTLMSLAPARCPTVARRTPRTCAPPSGLSLRRDPLQRRRCLANVTARSPPELCLLQVLSLFVVGAPSRPLRSWP